MTDNFVLCRHCGSDVCYEFKGETSIIWKCMDCGFYTNTMMLKNSEMVKYLEDTSPELFKDIAFEDADGCIWWPIVLNKPKVGIIFPDGTSKDNWCWSFAPEVLIPQEERYKYPIKGKIGEFHEYRVSMTDKKSFDQMDFILAMEAANLLTSMEG